MSNSAYVYTCMSSLLSLFSISECDKDHWGKDCLQRCLCDNGECHHINGACDCSPGWIGTYCNISMFYCLLYSIILVNL